MKKVAKGLKIIILSLAAVFLLAQLIRIDKSNPSVRSDLASGSAKPCTISARSSISRVRGARSHLNFSEWGTYDSGTRSHKLRAIAEEVKGGDMPPWYYSFVHRDSRLSASDRNQILAWVEETIRLETK